MDSLSVCAGLDAGSYESKAAYSDGLGTRIIARREGFDLRGLREECEAFCDEPVFSCVVAADSVVRAEGSGFTEIHELAQSEAAILGLGRDGKNVVYDLGASGCRMYVLDSRAVLESVKVDDVCGNMFDAEFAEYLAERYGVEKVDLRDARRIKHELTGQEVTVWHECKIYRYELERIIHFPVKRTARVLQRLCRVYKPEGVILTGGSVKILEVWKVLAEVSGFTPEYRGNLIVEGAAMRARELQKGSRQTRRKIDTGAKLRELRAGMLELEDKLTRRQKDRVYSLFRQAEGINDAGIISLMEGLLREIRNA